MAHGDARGGKWRGNWWMVWVASTLHTTSEHGVSSITTAEAHTSAASSRLNWRPRWFKWTRPFRWKTKSAFWACAITFQTQSRYRNWGERGQRWGRSNYQKILFMVVSLFCFVCLFLSLLVCLFVYGRQFVLFVCFFLSLSASLFVYGRQFVLFVSLLACYWEERIKPVCCVPFRNYLKHLLQLNSAPNFLLWF